MAFDAHFPPGFTYHPCLIYQEGRSFNTHIGTAIKFFFLPYTEQIAERAAFIGDELKWQIILCFKIIMLANAISGYSNNCGVRIIKIF